MAKGCMERLNGKWTFSREPIPGGKLTAIHLNSDARGKVKDMATIIINKNPVDFDVDGHYNGASVDIEFTIRSIESEFNFTYVGNCHGANSFDGVLSGQRRFDAQLKYKG